MGSISNRIMDINGAEEDLHQVVTPIFTEASKPFSEPETIAIKEFLEENTHIKIVLSYHTFLSYPLS